MGALLDLKLISTTSLIDFFPSPQMRLSFLQRAEENSPYVHSYPEQNQFNQLIRYDFGCGEIRPVYTVHLEEVLPAWRNYLTRNNRIIEDNFETEHLELLSGQVRYKDITANKIIFCDGHRSSFHSYFSGLPFAPNKGELLLVEVPGLPPHHIYKKGMMIVPMATKDQFWIGSTYAWEFDHTDPTNEFRVRTEHWLTET